MLSGSIISDTSRLIGCRLMAILVLSLLFGVVTANAGFCHDPDNMPAFAQVSDTLVFGPFQLKAPQGYFYAPRKYPSKGLDKNEEFLVTFFETKTDIPSADLRVYRPPKNVVFNLYVFVNTFKDFQDYYNSISLIYKANKISESDRSRKDLPEEIKAAFDNIPGWSCQEEISRGYPPLYTIECVMLGEYGVILAAMGDEDSVLRKSSTLKNMVLSLKVSRQ